MRDIPRPGPKKPKESLPRREVTPGPKGTDATKQAISGTQQEGTAPSQSKPNPEDLARILAARRLAASGETPDKPEKLVNRPDHVGLAKLARRTGDRAEMPERADAPILPNQTPPSQRSKESPPVTDKPATSAGPPTPKDVARQLAKRLEGARAKPVGEHAQATQKPETSKGDSSRSATKEVTGAPSSTSPQEVPARVEQKPEHTNAPSTGKGSLSRQLEGTGLERHDRTREHLDRLDRATGSSSPEWLQELTKATQPELAKAISYYKDGRIDEASLRDIIGRIGGPYAMHSYDANYPEHRFAEITSGTVAELRHINRLIESDQATSAIIAGARPGTQYTLEHRTTGAIERVSTTPVRDADILYLGRDGKVHIDEIKITADALSRSLSKGPPEQLQHLAAWQMQDPARHEARIVLDSPKHWTNLLEKMDGKQPSSPNSADLLVEHRISIHVGNATLRSDDLIIIKRQVHLVVGDASGARRQELLHKLSQFAPKDVQQGNFQL